MAMIKFEEVTVKFPLYNTRNQSLRHQIVRIATGGRISSDSRKLLTITAIDNLNLSIHSGDTVGIIGHNGAGKSTLLRTMAGIYTQNSGRITREGKISTVLEIGAGMEPELTGHENIIRVGMLMGLSLHEIRDKASEIEDFSELGDYLHLPVRTYSAGMTMRLMFAIASSSQPEVLLIDEMFSTGDINFQVKAKERLKKMIEKSEIVVISSHDTELMNQVCTKWIHLENGKIVEK